MTATVPRGQTAEAMPADDDEAHADSSEEEGEDDDAREIGQLLGVMVNAAEENAVGLIGDWIVLPASRPAVPSTVVWPDAADARYDVESESARRIRKRLDSLPDVVQSACDEMSFVALQAFFRNPPVTEITDIDNKSWGMTGIWFNENCDRESPDYDERSAVAHRGDLALVQRIVPELLAAEKAYIGKWLDASTSMTERFEMAWTYMTPREKDAKNRTAGYLLAKGERNASLLAELLVKNTENPSVVVTNSTSARVLFCYDISTRGEAPAIEEQSFTVSSRLRNATGQGPLLTFIKQWFRVDPDKKVYDSAFRFINWKGHVDALGDLRPERRENDDDDESDDDDASARSEDDADRPYRQELDGGADDGDDGDEREPALANNRDEASPASDSIAEKRIKASAQRFGRGLRAVLKRMETFNADMASLVGAANASLESWKSAMDAALLVLQALDTPAHDALAKVRAVEHKKTIKKLERLRKELDTFVKNKQRTRVKVEKEIAKVTAAQEAAPAVGEGAAATGARKKAKRGAGPRRGVTKLEPTPEEVAAMEMEKKAAREGKLADLTEALALCDEEEKEAQVVIGEVDAEIERVEGLVRRITEDSTDWLVDVSNPFDPLAIEGADAQSAPWKTYLARVAALEDTAQPMRMEAAVAGADAAVAGAGVLTWVDRVGRGLARGKREKLLGIVKPASQAFVVDADVWEALARAADQLETKDLEAEARDELVKANGEATEKDVKAKAWEKTSLLLDLADCIRQLVRLNLDYETFDKKYKELLQVRAVFTNHESEVGAPLAALEYMATAETPQQLSAASRAFRSKKLVRLYTDGAGVVTADGLQSQAFIRFDRQPDAAFDPNRTMVVVGMTLADAHFVFDVVDTDTGALIRNFQLGLPVAPLARREATVIEISDSDDDGDDDADVAAGDDKLEDGTTLMTLRKAMFGFVPVPVLEKGMEFKRRDGAALKVAEFGVGCKFFDGDDVLDWVELEAPDGARVYGFVLHGWERIQSSFCVVESVDGTTKVLPNVELCPAESPAAPFSFVNELLLAARHAPARLEGEPVDNDVVYFSAAATETIPAHEAAAALTLIKETVANDFLKNVKDFAEKVAGKGAASIANVLFDSFKSDKDKMKQFKYDLLRIADVLRRGAAKALYEDEDFAAAMRDASRMSIDEVFMVCERHLGDRADDFKHSANASLSYLAEAESNMVTNLARGRIDVEATLPDLPPFVKEHVEEKMDDKGVLDRLVSDVDDNLGGFDQAFFASYSSIARERGDVVDAKPLLALRFAAQKCAKLANATLEASLQSTVDAVVNRINMTYAPDEEEEGGDPGDAEGDDDDEGEDEDEGADELDAFVSTDDEYYSETYGDEGDDEEEKPRKNKRKAAKTGEAEAEEPPPAATAAEIAEARSIVASQTDGARYDSVQRSVAAVESLARAERTAVLCALLPALLELSDSTDEGVKTGVAALLKRPAVADALLVLEKKRARAS